MGNLWVSSRSARGWKWGYKFPHGWTAIVLDESNGSGMTTYKAGCECAHYAPMLMREFELLEDAKRSAILYCTEFGACKGLGFRHVMSEEAA